jgi:cell division protein FtsL
MWIFPWRIILAILLAFAIIVLSGTMWYKKFKKKEVELVEELKEEKTELEALKEELKDKISGEPPKDGTPPSGNTP